MNSCQKLSDLFSEYVERTLQEEGRHVIEVHLQACPPCQETVDRLGKLRRNLKSLSVLKTSPDFDTVLRTRMHLERHRLLPWVFAMPLAPARAMAFAFIIVVLVGGSVYTYKWYITPGPAPAMHVSTASTSSDKINTATSRASLRTASYQRYYYAMDRFTMPKTPGDALRISSVGIEKFQAMQADSSASETQPTTAEPMLISF